MNYLIKNYVNTVMEELGIETLEMIREDINTNKSDDDIFSLLKEEIELMSESNFIDNNDYRLTDIQFERCLSSVTTRLILDNLIEEGLVEVDFDVELGQNIFSLTEKGKQTTKNIFDLF